jgi:hypothetical protein
VACGRAKTGPEPANPRRLGAILTPAVRSPGIRWLALLVGSTGLLAVPSAVRAHPHYEAPFLFSPPDPLTDERVTFSSLAREGGSWDFDGDGRCDDARGVVIRKQFRRAGRYRVTLCLSDGGRTTHEVVVADPQATFAFVRLAVSVNSRSTQVRLLRVRRS